ncbi:MAG: endolytic transglycosylase MltG [Patescibacteria group bacterium]
MARSSPPRNAPQLSKFLRRKTKNTFPFIGIGIAFLVGVAVLSFPAFYSFQLQQEAADRVSKPFPISVDPTHKAIVENPEVDALFNAKSEPLDTVSMGVSGIFGQIATAIASIPGYEMLGAVGVRFVTIYPGFRQEQVASAFGKVLHWDTKEQKEFLSLANSATSTSREGTFAPGTYVVSDKTNAADVERILKEKFDDTILSRYDSSTAAIIPLDQTLAIASLLERETSDPNEMRLISGIIWNRIWNGMNLQIDATLQYAKSSANGGKGGEWWPKIAPKDKYIKSPYNTYLHAGLPPAPIANPSVAAVIAALNPKKTDCIFYFHDKNGDFHCSATYKEHVALLKKSYGQGK